MHDLAVIGAGAAGIYAAIRVKEKFPDLSVTVFEKSKNTLSKVRISGGGRCNVTHACFDTKQLCTYYPRGQKELQSVFGRFGPQDTISWFRTHGVELKTEADGRVFPVSDSSETIISCLLDACSRLGIVIMTSHAVLSLKKENNFILEFEHKKAEAKTVLLACGASNAFLDILRNMGHTIVEALPSLFTFNISDPAIADLQGISVQFATVSLHADQGLMQEFRLQKKDLQQTGPLLITHWGLSGPAILKLSSVAARLLNALAYRFEISVNLSGMNTDATYAALLKFKSENAKKQAVQTAIFGIPQRWWQRIHSLCISNTNANWADISNKELHGLAVALSAYTMQVDGKSTFKEEFVTAGGVSLKEINFRNMESKIIPGLYIAGEILDIDALTGGFNFQAAWSEAFVFADSYLPR